MRTRHLHIFLIVALLWAASSQAALTPGLDSAFSVRGSDAKLPVLIALNGTNLSDVNEQLLAQRAFRSLAARHQALIDTLVSQASSAQTEIANSLAILEKNGMLENRKPLWFGNLIAANVNRAGAELVANLETVDEVGLDVEVTPLSPLSVTPSQAKLLNLEPSLREINAPLAWASGATGEGTSIAILGPRIEKPNPVVAASRINISAPDISPSPAPSDANIPIGLILGLDSDKGDTLGLAYAAKWIASANSPYRLSDVLILLQSFVDPDKNSSTFEDVPSVILHAWEAEKNCQSAAPQSAWRALGDAELLGPIPVFAAGDHGADGRGILALPAARADEQLSAFSVGNADFSNGASEMHPSSSRGPSPCDLRSIKPELSAPGTSVRTYSQNGVVTATGSLCAASYVAAACALMRQVNPEITAATARIALQLSARDLGLPGEDNDFGFGLLDVAAAIENARGSSQSGIVSGNVRYGGTLIADARVFLTSIGGSFVGRTDANGNFRIAQVPTDRKFALYVARFGFQDFIAPDSLKPEPKQESSVLAQLTPGYADDAEVDRAFSLGVRGDNATSGIWTRTVPVPSYQDGTPVQVAQDVTPYGSFCFVTGNASSPTDASGVADVDGGKTTLRSPAFDLSLLGDPTLTFHYAYSNHLGPQKGGDFFTAQISNDDGASWTNLIHTSLPTDGWQEVELKLSDFITPTDKMVIQFIAEDNAPPSLVEAAVDEIRIEGKSDALPPPINLQLTPQSDGVTLYWNSSQGARSYGVYMSNDEQVVYAPGNYVTSVKDTFVFIPFTQIPYDQPYFQVVAEK